MRATRSHQGITASHVALAAMAAVTLFLSPNLSAVSAQVEPGYADILAGSASENRGGVLFATSQVRDTIPRFPSQFNPNIFEGDDAVLVFGFAWLNSETNEAIVAAIHPSFRDSAQNPDAWHTHPVSLSSVAGVTCIKEIGTSQGGISLKDNVMKLRMAHTFTNGLVPDTLASFTVEHNPSCPTPNLEVKVLDFKSIS